MGAFETQGSCGHVAATYRVHMRISDQPKEFWSANRLERELDDHLAYAVRHLGTRHQNFPTSQGPVIKLPDVSPVAELLTNIQAT